MNAAVPAAVLGGACLWLVLVLTRKPPFQQHVPQDAPAARRVRLPASRLSLPVRSAVAGLAMAMGAAVLLRNLLAGVLLAPLGWQAAVAWEGRRETQARRQTDTQVRVAVDLVAEEMAVTASAQRALEQAAGIVTGEVREVMERALGACALGRPLGTALVEAAGDRADLRTLGRLMQLTDERSAEAARGLGRLAEALREREVLRANRLAEAAGARTVALLLLAAPLAVIFGQALVSPDIITRNGLGRAAVDWVAGTTSLAAWWLRRVFEEEDSLT